MRALPAGHSRRGAHLPGAAAGRLLRRGNAVQRHALAPSGGGFGLQRRRRGHPCGLGLRAFVVELSSGPLAGHAADRHAEAILRLAESQGGYATVLAKGEHDAGTIVLVTMCRGKGAVLYERMPQLDGSRKFLAAKREDAENPQEFSEYLARRRRQDQDMWLIEVDIADPQRFVAQLDELI